MVYGYIRVSSDKQTVENQRFEISNFCKARKIEINGWIEEKISGTKTPNKRKLGYLLTNIKEGDTIICSEISRLGRSLYMVMDILSLCMEKGVKIITIKDNFVLGEDIQSKVLAFAFGLSAEIERNLISQRTKEALAMRKANGVHVGRPKGSTNINTKLTPYIDTIKVLINQGTTFAEIGRIFHVNKSTVKRFCDSRRIVQPKKRNQTITEIL